MSRCTEVGEAPSEEPTPLPVAFPASCEEAGSRVFIVILTDSIFNDVKNPKTLELRNSVQLAYSLESFQCASSLC